MSGTSVTLQGMHAKLMRLSRLLEAWLSYVLLKLDYGTICAVPLMAALRRFVHWARRGQASKCHARMLFY